MELIESRNELKANALVIDQVLEAAKSGLFRYRFDTLVLDGDSRFYRNVGLAHDHAEGISMGEIVSRMEAEDLQLMDDLVKSLNQNKDQNHYQVEIKLHCFDGQTRWFEDRGQVTQRDSDGQVLEFRGIRTDITSRKLREEQLLLLESTVTNATEAILVTDANLENDGPQILYVNRAFEEMTGYSLKEAIGKSPRFLQGAATDLSEVKKMGAAIRNKEAVNVEVINYHKNGTPYWVELSIVPVLNNNQELTHFVALERDTTEEHRKREELKELLLRLELATRANGVGVWDLDLETKTMLWDDNMLALYGLSPDDFDNSMEAWERNIHPDDQEFLRSELDRAINSTDQDLDLRFRINGPDGLRYIAATARISRDERGKAHRIVGIDWDITEIEESRIEIEQLRQNTQALINSTKDHMWSIDARFRLLSANDNYLDYLNKLGHRRYTKGDSAVDDDFGKERNIKWRKIYRRVLGGERVQMEMDDTQSADKRIYSIYLYPIFNEANIITGVACYSFDNTERTQYLQTIEQQNSNLKDIAWMQSHVMRAPLARILGLLEILKDESPKMDPSMKEIVDLIRSSSEEMDEVIREITAKTERFELNS